ncbi:dihydrofolate reductase family protein [Salinibacterium sp. ZJ70]|uniref:dihydrofolate reductase family protein n=1 Tax=Salinibacterium sp. ZJ70 TaxID=2708084 RepID=UPI001421CD3F|nr:dihydrofolate reductase family protein [Salinibacterium sp. ZJ70]
MILTPVLPRPGAPLEVGAPETREVLRELYRRAPGAPGVRVNIITSVDGSVQGADGTSESLSNRADRAILGAIRAESDVVLVGAATIRTEGYLLPRTARLAIVASGDLSGARVGDEHDPAKILILAPESARDRVHATLAAPHTFVEVRADAHDRVDLRAALDALRLHGAESVVCEGGPQLIGQLMDADLVGELCISTSPTWMSGGAPLLAAGARRGAPLQLASLLTDDAGGIYARWILSA